MTYNSLLDHHSPDYDPEEAQDQAEMTRPELEDYEDWSGATEGDR